MTPHLGARKNSCEFLGNSGNSSEVQVNSEGALGTSNCSFPLLVFVLLFVSVSVTVCVGLILVLW